MNIEKYEYLKRFIDIYKNDYGVKLAEDKVWATYTILEKQIIEEKELKDEPWLYENFNYFEYDNPQPIATIEGVDE